ncbi:MAG: DegT/DnrJ/EryC1/StrS family aminotransferase [Anaerolineae bacterium]
MNKYGQEEIANLTRVIESGNFADHAGGFMDQLRHDYAQATGARHAITAATAMLLMHAIPGAIGAGAGDEIICDPVVQFHGIACLHNNIVPVWADVRPGDFLMDADSVEALITPRTRAIWVTHLWGYAAEVDKLREIADRHGIYLLEDCAHAMLGEYKGKKLGTWGHFGTFSFNMGKQLATGEGGIAITNDDKLAFELNRRIIFGESPEVLSSNYRMTEFQAAVAVAQLPKVPGYLEEYRRSKAILDGAIAGCGWLEARALDPELTLSPYFWSCLFHGERSDIAYGVFKAALRQAGAPYGTGFLQVPAYQYAIFRNPNAYGNKGCPYNCHLYDGKVEWPDGLCPVAEDVIPRIVHTNNMITVDKAEQAAARLREAIKLAESGQVAPLEYSKLDNQVLQVVREFGPCEPTEVIERFDANGWQHLDEHGMFTTMENLRDRFPRKLSHAGPRKFAYHDLSK